MPVGNDIVDLRDPESALESLHPRFLHRVFSAVERRELAAHPGPLELWSRWAAKEAAYKALSGDRPPSPEADADAETDAEAERLIFSPRAFATVLDPPTLGSPALDPPTLGSPALAPPTLAPPTLGSPRRGWVVHRALGLRVPVRLFTSEAMVHAVAATAGELDGAGLIAVTLELDIQARDTPSLAVRRAARSRLAQYLGCDLQQVQIQGRRPPRFLIDGLPWYSSLSISHHGRWAAFSFFSAARGWRCAESLPDGRFFQRSRCPRGPQQRGPQ